MTTRTEQTSREGRNNGDPTVGHISGRNGPVPTTPVRHPEHPPPTWRTVADLRGVLWQLERLAPRLSQCPYCKRVGDDRGDWQQFEWRAICKLEGRFNRVICPRCYERVVKPEVVDVYDRLRSNGAPRDARDTAVRIKLSRP